MSNSKLFEKIPNAESDVRRRILTGYTSLPCGVVPVEVVEEAGPCGGRTQTYFAVCVFKDQNITGSLKRSVEIYELGVGNNGILFDVLGVLIMGLKMFGHEPFVAAKPELFVYKHKVEVG